MVESAFSAASTLAMTGWMALAASHFGRLRSIRPYPEIIVPLLLSAAYAALILTFWAGADGGFSTLADVTLLFQTPKILLAGWLHYLAFDLLIGAWIVRANEVEGLPFALLLPILALTFLFGPVGYLVFQMLRLARSHKLGPA
ncbi:abscisic acid-deficient protein Aba4 family protein [Rhizobium sp. EC-SD404]|uniref:abscisic acid-deficient protein Aba4 family protein n=1 Tax=Rhizobium sp. EC-SD404 TaxID=2038389 RepID=UPI001251D67F|nr:abscisic acid-deficient protein Aba4 family protein [Rhizobium sp. EC-SD404]VVT05553.1 conserved membrane hypothetical protein [Rhizobium sp. EC-SD404]